MLLLLIHFWLRTQSPVRSVVLGFIGTLNWKHVLLNVLKEISVHQQGTSSTLYLPVYFPFLTYFCNWFCFDLVFIYWLISCGRVPERNETYCSTCTACKPGSFQPNDGQYGCVLCPAGTFQDTWGSTVCKPCSKGYVQTEKGAVSCIPCPGGKSRFTFLITKISKLNHMLIFQYVTNDIVCSVDIIQQKRLSRFDFILL